MFDFTFISTRNYENILHSIFRVDRWGSKTLYCDIALLHHNKWLKKKNNDDGIFRYFVIIPSAF